jgi:hypothetical protein
MEYMLDRRGKFPLRGARNREKWSERRAFPVYIRMRSEAILHPLKLLNAVDTLGLVLRIDETREGVSEFLSARAVSHPA